jgi:L-asparaginase
VIARGESGRFLSRSQSAALRRIAEYDYIFVSDEGSPDIKPDLWADIARLIDKHRAQYAGFVVTHGTDTLAWAAAALSFALCGIPTSVILTGAMRPLAEEGSDGWPNLLHSFEAISRRLLAGVSVVFGTRILHGCRARKLSYTPADAFDSPAVPPVAKIGETIQLSPHMGRPRVLPSLIDESRRFCFHSDVAFVPISPNLQDTVFSHLGWSRGVVVETYLSGTIPRRLLPALEALAAERPVVVSIENGRLTAPNWPQYPAYLISARDMTREAAVVKLMWALAQSADREALRHLMTSNVVGEISIDG